MDGYLICCTFPRCIFTLISFSFPEQREGMFFDIITYLFLDKTDAYESTQKTEDQAKLETYAVVSNNFFFQGSSGKGLLNWLDMRKLHN